MTPLGLYVHVPFCAKKCPYCDFYSEAYSTARAQQYTAAVVRSILAYPKGLSGDTLYFGGGTPSLLPTDCLAKIIDTAASHFSLTSPEITLEVNPNTATPQKLRQWKDLGVNRLSIGVQSCVDVELRALGRRHTAAQALDAVARAAALFENLSCDLMLGIPHQTADSLAASLKTLAGLPIRHISAYLLSIEAGTPFDCDATRAAAADEETMAARYLQMVGTLAAHGFLQYEISNFAKPGFESRHNLKYWTCVDYIGIGPAAHSCFGGHRYAVPPDLEAFCKASVQPETETDATCYTPEERVMLGLRLTAGIALDTLPPDFTKRLRERAVPLVDAGYLHCTEERIALTPQGFLVSNAIIARLVD